MVIPNEPTETDQTIEDSLSEIKQQSKLGRNLAKALRKLKEGKLKTPSIKVGIMAAILALPNPTTKKALLGYWVDTIEGKLV